MPTRTRCARPIAAAVLTALATLATLVSTSSPASAQSATIDIDCTVTTPRSGAVSEFTGRPLGPHVRKVGCRATVTPPSDYSFRWRFDDAVEINPDENPVRGYCRAGRWWEAEVGVHGPDGQPIGEVAERFPCPHSAAGEHTSGLCAPPSATLSRVGDNLAEVTWSYPTTNDGCDSQADYFRIRIASGFTFVDHVVWGSARRALVLTHPDTPGNAPIHASVFAGSVNGESLFSGTSQRHIIGDYQATYTHVASNSPYGAYVTPDIDGWIAVRDTDGDGGIDDRSLPAAGLYPVGRELAPGANAVVGLRLDSGDHVVAHINVEPNRSSSEIVHVISRHRGIDRSTSALTPASIAAFDVSTNDVVTLSLLRAFGQPDVSLATVLKLADE
ncbi:MAG: hypothetical protein AAF467_24720 [Actinomycetota bacterium]